MDEYRRSWEQRFDRLDAYLRELQRQAQRCSRSRPQQNEQKRDRKA